MRQCICGIVIDLGNSMKLWLDRIHSEIGIVFIVSDGTSLCAIDFINYEHRMRKLLSQRYDGYELVEKSNPQGFSDRLRAYFDRDFTAFNDLPVNPGGTAFQQQVWQALRAIPVGKTWTYGELAQHLGKPTASRAVGMANSLNPISIVLPCHRVVGANGKLTGYAGGLDRKRWLLDHETMQMAVNCFDGASFHS
jgi:methylated-DNA-[protein]-cysteine S-methyltransferase